jgi:hypothetical protein
VEDVNVPNVEWTNWKQVGGTLTFDEVKFKNYLDTDVVRGHYYRYRVEIYSGTTLLEHTSITPEDDADHPDFSVQPSTAYRTLSKLGQYNLITASFTPEIITNIFTTPATETAVLQVYRGPEADLTRLLKGAQLFIYKEGGGTELLGSIQYAPADITATTTAIGIRQGYYVSLTADTIRKLRLISDYKFVTHYTNAEQQPKVVENAVSLTSTPTIKTLLSATQGTIVKSTGTGIDQGRVYWTLGGGNTVPWLIDATLYYSYVDSTGNSVYEVLGKIAYNSAVTDTGPTPTTALLKAESYYVTINTNAWRTRLYTGASGSSIYIFKEDNVEQLSELPSYNFQLGQAQYQ